jgi:hypothetical protein
MAPKTKVKVSRVQCDIGGNVFSLISTAFNALERAGHKKEAAEMSSKIDAEAESPSDVLKIVKEYVTIT